MHARSSIFVGAVAALVASSAWAITDFGNPNASPSGAHYRQGYSEPVCSVADGRMTCTGTQIAGIGNLDGDVVLSVTVSGTIVCDNGGGNRVEVKAQLKGTTTGDALTKNRNGTLIVSEVSAAVASSDDLLASGDCPKNGTNNKNWTKSLSDYAMSYTYTLTMDGFQDPIIHQP